MAERAPAFALSLEDAPTGRDQAETRPAGGYFTEVPAYAGILYATAETLELLHAFLADADPVARTHLSRFLITRRPDEDTGDPGRKPTSCSAS